MAGIILACISFTVHAQSDKLSLTINAGGGISSIRPIYDTDFGFKGELQARYQLNPIFSAAIGVGYEQIGVRENITYYDQIWAPMYTYNTRISFDYIALPMLFRAEFGKNTKYFVNAGPTIGYLLNRTYHYSEQTDNTLYNAQNDGGFKNLNTCISFGAGAEIPMGEKTALSLEIRDNFGFTDISNSDLTNLKTNTLHLLIGLNIAM